MRMLVWGLSVMMCSMTVQADNMLRTHSKLPEALGDQWEFVGEVINEPGWHVWGSSPVRDADGKVHLFSARYPSHIPFNHGWRWHSEIAHYVADNPEGPFTYVSTVGKGTGQGWNAAGWHNPSIRKIGNQYVLVFIANDGAPRHGWTQRIGMMVADDLAGPWRLVPDDDTPLLSPPGDRSVWCSRSGSGVTNPTLLAHPNGKFYLYFKARGGPTRRSRLSIGVAIADQLEGPYVIQKEPVTANDRNIEDGFAFMWRDHVCLITTDNHGMLEEGGGLLWFSKDGIHFEDPPLSAFRKLASSYLGGVLPDSIKIHYGRKDMVKLERPQLLLDAQGEPEYLYAPSGAALDGSDGTNAHVLRRITSREE
jgi:hypothetical protein